MNESQFREQAEPAWQAVVRSQMRTILTRYQEFISYAANL